MNPEEVLKTLFETKDVYINSLNRKVKIKHATLRTLGPSLIFLQNVMEDLKLDSTNMPTINFRDPAAILKLVAPRLPAVLDLVASHCEATVEELNDMPLDESVEIIRAVVLLNKDFFMRKVAPLVMPPKVETPKAAEEPEQLPQETEEQA